MDLAPSLFENVTILKDPGYNVAYWNLHGRKVHRAESGYQVNGQPLVFFHFSGIEPESLDGVSKHQNRFRLTQTGDASKLYRNYASALFEAGFRTCRHWPFAYGVFDNGVKIPNSVRRQYLELPTRTTTEIRRPFHDHQEKFLALDQ